MVTEHNSKTKKAQISQEYLDSTICKVQDNCQFGFLVRYYE